MATVGVDGISLQANCDVGWLCLRVGDRLALGLHSSNEPS